MDVDYDQKELLLTILAKYKLLLRILEMEGTNEVNFAVSQLHNDIFKIEDTLENGDTLSDYNQTLHLLKANYSRMYPPRGGLTEFIIWRDDFSDRIVANKPLIDTQEELKNIYSSII